MKKILYTLPLLILAFAACTSEEPGIAGNDSVNEQAPKEDKYYITLNVTLPTQNASSRSATDNTGNTADNNQNVPGVAAENELKSAKIYLCQGSEVKAVFNQREDISFTNGSKTVITAEVTDISVLTALCGTQVNLLVVCNADETLNWTSLTSGGDAKSATFSLQSTTDIKPIGDYSNNAATNPSQGLTMPLVSAADCLITLPGEQGGNADDNLLAIKGLFTQGTATNLTYPVPDVVNLERAVARIEYKDASTAQNHTYTITDNSVKLQLVELQPFNINKTSYLFRHISEGGYDAATGVPSLLGNENGGIADKYNWVADPSWGTSTTPFTKSKNFYNTLSTTDYTLSNVVINALSTSTIDGRTASDAGGYKPL